MSEFQIEPSLIELLKVSNHWLGPKDQAEGLLLKNDETNYYGFFIRHDIEYYSDKLFRLTVNLQVLLHERESTKDPDIRETAKHLLIETTKLKFPNKVIEIRWLTSLNYVYFIELENEKVSKHSFKERDAKARAKDGQCNWKKVAF